MRNGETSYTDKGNYLVTLPHDESIISTSEAVESAATMSATLDIVSCFEFAKKLTLEAGEIIKRNFKDDESVKTKGEDWNVVTEYDRKVEELLVKGLMKEFPDHKFIAEETVNAGELPELTNEPTWLIDPIDGTLNFIHTFPYACISVGLTVCKEPVMGIIYNPSKSELYTAIKGKGAFLNGEPIRTSKITELKKALQIHDSSYIYHLKDVKQRDIAEARSAALLSAAQCNRNLGSAGMSMAFVARGAVDCFNYDQLEPWDVAAGLVIIREAGGTVIDTKGGVYDIMKPRTIAAANETLAREMCKLIVDTDLKTQRKRLQRT